MSALTSYKPCPAILLCASPWITLTSTSTLTSRPCPTSRSSTPYHLVPNCHSKESTRTKIHRPMISLAREIHSRCCPGKFPKRWNSKSPSSTPIANLAEVRLNPKMRIRIRLGACHVRQPPHGGAFVVRRKMRVLARYCRTLVAYDLSRDKVGDTRCFQHCHRTVAQTVER